MTKKEQKYTDRRHTKVIVKKGDSGPAVEDIQRKLCKLEFLKDSNISSFYDETTARAVMQFSEHCGLAPTEDVTVKVWAMLVDASFQLGDRNLFLRIPYLHGNDVLQLQKALGSLGFDVNKYNGIFGTSTERAVRRFQISMGLPSDGIVGSQTFMTLRNLKFTWSDKKPLADEDPDKRNVWRASEVLESNSICLYGTDAFTRDVAIRMSNLARATNPFSKVLSSDSLSVAPDKDTILLKIALPEEMSDNDSSTPLVQYAEFKQTSKDQDETINNKIGTNQDDFIEDPDKLVIRLTNAIIAAKNSKPVRFTIQLPSTIWFGAGQDRSAQHFAISCLDALCSALENVGKLKQEK